jgi:Ni,Fe-hydrogenase I large subunit
MAKIIDISPITRIEGHLDFRMEVQHVIRSFDPCIACTVHLIRGRETICTLEMDV